MREAVDPDREIVSNWISPVRETRWGPMSFRFRIRDDGLIDVTGSPVGPSDEGIYRRSGPYHLGGNLLVTPALKDGQPVGVRIEDGQLLLEIDDELSFRLGRE